MGNVAAHCLANCSRIGTVPIGCHLVRNTANDRNCLPEKSLSRLPVPLLAQQRINQIAIVVDRSIQITPFPLHFDGGFVNIPGGSRLPPPLGSQLICYQWGKSHLPVSNSFMREGEAAF
jgi:hypothetical protein